MARSKISTQATAGDSKVQQARQRFSIVGNSPALLEAIARAVTVAPIDLSVLITGESGTGKEFFPQIIHAYGVRKHKKYIAVNCGAIPEGTIDSELFGHEKGSFTGAVSARKGYFEEASGGTIFLDEVAELPLTTQARLLRVLETGEFLKVGSSQVQKTDIRIVAATNVDLVKAVERGRFREDLYYRLSTVQINVPRLQDRGADDIALLARKFASDFAERYMTSPISFSAEARRVMSLYSWPGNVRQLKNVVEQLALFDAGSEISRRQMLEALPSAAAEAQTPASMRQAPNYETEREMLWQTVWAMRAEINDLRSRLDDARSPMHTESAEPPTSVRSLVKLDPEPLDSPLSALRRSERDVIEEALRRNDGNKRQTAADLDISERTLYRKIREYGIDTSHSTPIDIS